MAMPSPTFTVRRISTALDRIGAAQPVDVGLNGFLTVW
jgi:hypothetical protein